GPRTDNVLHHPSLACHPQGHILVNLLQPGRPVSSLSRFTRNTWFDVAIHSHLYLSSARPSTCSRKGAGTSLGTRKLRRSPNEMPDAVPTQSTPVESSIRQFTFSDGKPFWAV